MRQKLVESGEKIKQFRSYNVLITQEDRNRNLKYFDK